MEHDNFRSFSDNAPILRKGPVIMKCLIILTGLIALFSFDTSRAQTSHKPRVTILTTGGTIASRSDAPMTDGSSLIQAVPELLRYADVRVEEFSRIGSSRMTPSHWLRLSRRINHLFKSDPNLKGIVITHGTDTMEETAFFLHLTVHDSRPVVLVGSMRSADDISADGPANLLNGVRVSVSDEAVGKGTLVVLNEEIASARDVWKTNNQRVQTFRSPEFGFLGLADPDTVIFYRSSLHSHTTQSEFNIAQLDSLPKVDIVTDYTGFDGSTIDHFLKRKPDGLVLTTFAGGRMSAGARKGLRSAIEAKMPLVIASRVPGGRIVGNPTGNLAIAIARDLPPHKARILLMLALTRSRNIDEIQRIFKTY